ncbi:MAG TPA: HipA domain-containing protein [Streptosporangiaceae bacterium]|nr:HipA domain-containing protein [Streptosporangiaceae bacterium]
MSQVARTPLRQLRLVGSADVYKAGTLAGTLRRMRDRTEFEYLPAYLAAGGPRVAWSLPPRVEAYIAPAAAVPAFFAGLLPEGRRLTALRRTVGTSADDEFSMLLAVGSDTIGDVQIVPAGDLPADTNPVMVDDFGEVVFADLFAQAIGQHPDRIALPGVQDKVSGQMLNLPVQGGSAGYILKLNPPEFPHLVENEYFFFHAAARTRLVVAEVELVHDKAGESGLLVHRFDRHHENRNVRPLAVEDACQVLGRWPGDKYLISTEEAITGLAQCCRAPGVAALELYRLLVFAYLSGNGDLHAKNLAILHDARGEWKVTPAYDLSSSAVYGDRTMALPLDGRIRQQLSLAMLRKLGKEIGIPDRLATGIVREQIAAARIWIEDLDELPFDANTIRNLRRLINARIRHIEPEPGRYSN